MSSTHHYDKLNLMIIHTALTPAPTPTPVNHRLIPMLVADRLILVALTAMLVNGTIQNKNDTAMLVKRSLWT
jgi:hypothetical protein